MLIDHPPKLKRRELFGLVVAGTAAMLPIPSFAKSNRIAKTKGLAIKGFDTTSYFQNGKPNKGINGNVVEWKGAKWRFATAAEAALFVANPSSFAPQFGGFCTRAMSLKRTIHGDPKVWRIRGKKLYLFAMPRGRVFFDKGPDKMIARAQAHWNTLP